MAVFNQEAFNLKVNTKRLKIEDLLFENRELLLAIYAREECRLGVFVLGKTLKEHFLADCMQQNKATAEYYGLSLKIYKGPGTVFTPTEFTFQRMCGCLGAIAVGQATCGNDPGVIPSLAAKLYYTGQNAHIKNSKYICVSGAGFGASLIHTAITPNPVGIPDARRNQVKNLLFPGITDVALEGIFGACCGWIVLLDYLFLRSTQRNENLPEQYWEPKLLLNITPREGAPISSCMQLERQKPSFKRLFSQRDEDNFVSLITTVEYGLADGSARRMKDTFADLLSLLDITENQ